MIEKFAGLNLKKDDLVIFDGCNFKPINKDYLLKREIELQKQIDELKAEIEKMKNDVNSALAQYHKALQVIVKGE